MVKCRALVRALSTRSVGRRSVRRACPQLDGGRVHIVNDLAVAFDGQYFAQVRRYYDERRDIERSCHDGQLDLFDYDDVEF